MSDFESHVKIRNINRSFEEKGSNEKWLECLWVNLIHWKLMGIFKLLTNFNTDHMNSWNRQQLNFMPMAFFLYLLCSSNQHLYEHKFYETKHCIIEVISYSENIGFINIRLYIVKKSRSMSQDQHVYRI